MLGLQESHAGYLGYKEGFKAKVFLALLTVEVKIFKPGLYSYSVMVRMIQLISPALLISGMLKMASDLASANQQGCDQQGCSLLTLVF